MPQSHQSIQQKFMTVIMLTSGIVLVMTCAAFFVYEFITAKEIAKRQLSTLGKIVAINSTAALAFESESDARETLNALRAEKHIVAACLFDSTGKLFAKYPNTLKPYDIPIEPFDNGYKFTQSYLAGFEPVIIDEKRIGTLFLRSDRTEMYERFALYGVIAIIFIIISFFFAYFISIRLQKTISSPLLELADTARQISVDRKYSIRAVKRSEDEVGQLTDAFNHMLTRIEQQTAEITGLNLNLEEKVKSRTRELEETNEALKQQTEFSEKILDSTVDLIAVFDTDLRYVTMNKHSEEIYNINRNDLTGKYIADIFPQVAQSGMLDDLRRAAKGEVIHHHDYKSAVTNRHYESYYLPMKDKDNKVYLILTIAHDITDIMQANQKLQDLNTELEKSNRELEQFAYVASHDLQEPLRKIQTFSELSERSLDNQEMLKSYLSKMNSSAQRMTELIKAVLNYSRLGKTDDEFVEVDLNAIVESIFADLELLIEEKKAIIKHDRLPVIRGIPLQLHQLFLNLITNSMKFTDTNPEIVIGCSIEKGKDLDGRLNLNESTEYVQLTFRDNGIGFDQKFEEKVFSIFQRLHNDRNFPGTGIGLSLCKKIVENHEGAITVQSQIGKGTTFFVYLPYVNVFSSQFTKISSTKK